MRLKPLVARALAFALLGFCGVLSSTATTKPLTNPQGLAVDSKGNLYVANSGGNDILVYNANYAQVSAKTITANISNPTALAFDPEGNLWVANYATSNGGANGSIAEYTNGEQNTANTITTGINGPQAMAIDGIGTLWVQNDYSNLTVYITNNNFAVPNSIFQTLSPQDPIYGIAIANGTIAYGGNVGTSFMAEVSLLNGYLPGTVYGGNGFTMNNDNKGGIYFGNSDGSILYYSPTLNVAYFLIYLNYFPTGIAVDNARGRIYIANYSGNWIDVYSTNGNFLHKIQ